MPYKIEDYREYYNEYFKQFNIWAVDHFADLSYGSYTPNATASSLESIIAYANYIGKVTGEMPILNAGAGASSWMLRKIFKQVSCVEPHGRYLSLVREVLCQNALYYNNMYHGMEAIRFTSYYDHVYYDYGDIERIPYLGLAIDIARKSIYVDDSDCRDDCRPYRQHVIDLCAAKGLKWFDCLEAKDEHNRWGIIIEK